MSNDNLIDIQPRLISPGDSNAAYKHCFAITYFQGKQLIAYGSANNVVITSNTFAIIDELKGEQPDSVVTAVAWATYSGRLSSFETNKKDHRIIAIWEPIRGSGRWERLQKINVDIEINCLSWSKGDNILCTASKQNFQILIREENKNKNCKFILDQYSTSIENGDFSLNCVYTNQIPTEFCSHSRDSRFILTLPMRPKKNSTPKDNQNSIKGVVLYYKRGKSDGDYNYILIKHPTPVVSARWRTSDESHGNCCFMSLSEDQVVRIWYETSVNESFKFSVVASLPSNRNILVASFISTSSKYIAKNPLFDTDNDENESEKADDSNDAFIHLSKRYKDVYAYGNGHLVKRDGNYRESYANDKTEDSQNFFYFLTFDKDQFLAIWKVTGLGSNIRTTPKITQLVTKDIKLGIEPDAVNNVYAFCRLTSEFSYKGKKQYVPQPMSLSLILQNNIIGSITSLDLSINTTNLYLTNFISIHGHQSNVKSIRINKDCPFMVTLGEKNNLTDKIFHNQPFVWKFNDTDVYDPSILANFFYQLEKELVAVDWLYSTSKLIGYNGTDFVILKLIRSNAPIVNILPTTIYFQFSNLPNSDNFNVLQFRVLCGEEKNQIYNYILAILFEHDFYLLHLYDTKITELLHLQEANDVFVDMCDSYISQLFHEAGALLCLLATKHKAYSIFLNKDILLSSTSKSTKYEDKNKKVDNKLAAHSTIFESEEQIRSLCYIHPAYYIIACDHLIYVCRRYSCSENGIHVFQKIPIDYIPKQIRCNPHGMISVVSESKIELYHQVRESSEFGKSNLIWKKFAQHEANNISVAEWSHDGFLIYAANENIYSLTKYMDTFYRDESKMFATVHNSMASFSRSIQDINSAVLIPLAVSGRTDLVLNMLDYLDQYSENPRMNWFYQDYVLNFNEESKKPFEKDVDTLLDSLYTKAKISRMSTFTERENDEFIQTVSNLKKLLAIQPESLDQRSIPVARAIALDEGHSIPFDLINLAYISHDQVKLMDFVNFQNWDSILNSGVFFWMKELKFLIDKLVPFAINNFATRKDISIIILSMTHKFVVLKTLFKKAGEEARAAFFGRDFSQPKEKKSAEKNGYSALSKHDFYTAAAMFVLAGNVPIAIRILMQNTPDVALAYLICRYTEDNNQSLFKMIDDFLLPRAKDTNDYAAIEFFKKQKDPDYQYSLDDRIRSENCGNLVPSSNHFYDMRFVACEILPTTIEQKADLCLCFLLSGANFLNTVYLSYLGNYVFHKSDSSSKLTESHSTNFDFGVKFQNFTDESENETDEMTEEPSDNEVYVKEIDAFSFGGVMGGGGYTSMVDDFSSSDDDDFDSESSSGEDKEKEDNQQQTEQPKQGNMSSRRYSFMSIKNTSSSSQNVIHSPIIPSTSSNENLAEGSGMPKMMKPSMVKFTSSGSNEGLEQLPSLSKIISASSSNEYAPASSPSSNDSNKEVFGNAKPVRARVDFSMPRNNPQNGQNPIRRMSLMLSNNISSLMNPTTANLANKHENYLIDETKMRKDSNTFGKNYFQIAKSAQKEAHSEGSDDSDETEIENQYDHQIVNLSISKGVQQLQSQANWLLDIVVFNIARLRLEQFTGVQFSSDENLISLIRTKINEANGNIFSMMTHFNDYLVRSCKRRGIVSRRLLLISNEGKQQYIQEICHCISLLPDQLIASKLTKQQIAQISRTSQVLVDIIERKLVDSVDKSTMFLSVTAAILTSIYIIALYKHDVKIMYKLMQIDLTQSNPKEFVSTIKSFLGIGTDNSIKNFFKVEFIPPGKYPEVIKENKWGRNYVSFLSDEMKRNFINSKKSPNLTQYASSLIDFMIIDTLIKKIKDLKSNNLVRKAKKGFFKDNFNLLLLNFKKSYDVITQLFTHSTINFPSFIEFDSLSDICENFDSDLNKFSDYLFSLDNRRDLITKYTMNIIQKFSLNSNSNISLKFASSPRSTPQRLSRMGSQNESNISTLNFSQLNDNINSTHKILSMTKIARNFKLSNLKSVANCSSSVYSIFLDKDNSSIFIATDNGVKKNFLNSKANKNDKISLSEKSNQESEGIFMHFNNDTVELINDFQENKMQNEEEEGKENQEVQNESKIQSQSKDDLDENEAEDEDEDEGDATEYRCETSTSESNKVSQNSTPGESSTTQGGKSKKSKSKRSFTISSNKHSKQPQPVLKTKISMLEETPTCAMTSPSGNSILVGYKNGKVDLIILSQPSQKASELSSESFDELSELSSSQKNQNSEKNEISEVSSNETGVRKRKKRRSSEKSESTENSKEGEKKRKRRDSDKTEKSESTENSKEGEKKRKRRDSDKTEKSESSETSKERKKRSDTSESTETKSEPTEQPTENQKVRRSKNDSIGKLSESTKSRKSKTVDKSDSLESLSGSTRPRRSKTTLKSDSVENLSESSKSKKSKTADKSESTEKYPQFPPSISPSSSKTKISLDFKYQKIVSVSPPTNTPCGSLAFSSDGQIIAASHRGTVSLWSLNTVDLSTGETPQLSPFSTIDTFSDECTHIQFLQGTALLVTAQVESNRFKGNLCFWDALLPNRAALIASLELKEQFGRVLSLSYSPTFSKMFVGTSRGFICVVDTKKFCIINTINCFSKKAHEGVQSIAIDASQLFIVSGSSSGNLKVFDVQDYTCLCEKEMVHSKKVLRSRGKLRDFSISAIAINDRMIYTCGYDGDVKSLYMNLTA